MRKKKPPQRTASSEGLNHDLVYQSMGAPLKSIDFDEFQRLCNMQCTCSELAAWFDMDEDTLQARIKEYYGETFSVVKAKYMEGGKASLRRVQWHKAIEDKNVVMMIWLGKQILGQSDKRDDIITDKRLETTPSDVIEAFLRDQAKKAIE